MKKYPYIIAAALTALPLNAQNITDATRFGSTGITGTARYRAMAGAFGALGGDPTAMSDNPGGMGVYRGTSEISFTPNLTFNRTTVDASVRSKMKKVDCSVSNLSYILSIRTPQCDHLVNFNIGVGFNHCEGIDRKYNITLDWITLDRTTSSFAQYLANRANNALRYTGMYNKPEYLENAWNDTDYPLSAVMAYDCYAIDRTENVENGVTTYPGGVTSYDEKEGLYSFQRMYVTEKNRNDEYNLNFSGNWDDVVFGGFTLTINDYNSTIETDMNEDYVQDYSGSYTHYLNDMETKGTGIGMKLGVIVKPVYFWRIGFAAHTPTWFRMEDIYSGKMATDDSRVIDYSGGEVYHYKYRYQSPWQMQFSSAWVIGKNGLVSIEADMKDFSTQKFKASRDGRDTDDIYNDINGCIKDYNAVQMTYKVGGEYRVTEHFSTRLGYAYKTSPYKSGLYDYPSASRSWSNGYFGDDNTLMFDSSTKPNHSLLGSQQYYSGGLGWSGNGWHIDLACMGIVAHEKVAAYPTTDAIYHVADNGTVTMTDDMTYGATRGTYCNMKSRSLAWDVTIGLKF